MSDDGFIGAITEDGKLTGNTATIIYTATLGATWVRSITLTDNTGATTAASIEKYDGTNSYYLRKSLALVAGLPYIYDTPFLLQHNRSIRLTSGDAAGKIDWSITYSPPPAASRPRQWSPGNA